MSERRSKVYLSVPHMGNSELTYVEQAFTQNSISTAGKNIELLEEEFRNLTGCPSVAMSSGTASLHLAIKLLNIKDGDEVLTPTLTFAASCNPLLYERATPVFVDSDRETWNLDPNILLDFLVSRAKVNRLPKAVMVVHLFGQSADLDPILQICGDYNVPLIEDAAESLGAKYKGRVPGSLGQIGVFSFNGNKIITGTSGGMLVSRHADWVEKARSCGSLGQFTRLGQSVSEVGYNYSMSNVLAGIVRGQLEVLPQRVEQRRAIAFKYKSALEPLGLDLMPQAPYGLHTNWLSCFLIDEQRFGLTQFQLIAHLDAKNIESRPVWKPMHKQKLYHNYQCIGGAVAEDLNCRGICLPSSSCLTEEDQRYVIGEIEYAHREAKRLRVLYPATKSCPANSFFGGNRRESGSRNSSL